jgi:phage gp36-like protein
MSYATLADLRERLGERLYVQLTDDAGTGVADENKAKGSLRAAAGEMDGYLARRYAVPIDTSGEESLAGLLKSLMLDLAEYRLHARRWPVPEIIKEKRDAAMHWLKKAGEGEVRMPRNKELPLNAAELHTKSSGNKRVLSRDTMKNL